MDIISTLSDDLLLKICSLLPTKDVFATTVLSKRWKFLWEMIHKLDFDDNFERCINEDSVNGIPSSYERFLQFVDRVMVLHKAPVIDTLKFKVGPWCNSEDMAHWMRIGIVRRVRQLELEISHSVDYYEYHESIVLPRSLYVYAKLEVLKLTNTILLDVITKDVRLPSLKSLHLLCVKYKTYACHCRLLSGCPVLEELVMDKSENSSLSCVCVQVPSLERLSILDTSDDDCDSKLVIDAPYLKYLNIVHICIW
ncbi:PREDICTED: putative FBD-associated F-box protein At3g50710 [Camelina sativa]|uniref:FBD-associated F-box protein At3g50710 n=1 Tax=Camelina sativa TaxID=90675 RepID=A0ABM0XFF1_CAMSA|nr:PREDICTED: putative FBD-associated F-box protein At3g50710 [Camelina sativa]